VLQKDLQFGLEVVVRVIFRDLLFVEVRGVDVGGSLAEVGVSVGGGVSGTSSVCEGCSDWAVAGHFNNNYY
jgi:hypothetical protein